MNIIDTLAQGDILKYDEVLKIDCRTALIKMLMEKETKEYQKRLNKIYMQKKK